MKNIRDFLSENFQFLEVKFSTYFNRRVFVILLLCKAPSKKKNDFLKDDESTASIRTGRLEQAV